MKDSVKLLAYALVLLSFVAVVLCFVNKESMFTTAGWIFFCLAEVSLILK